MTPKLHQKCVRPNIQSERGDNFGRELTRLSRTIRGQTLAVESRELGLRLAIAPEGRLSLVNLLALRGERG